MKERFFAAGATILYGVQNVWLEKFLATGISVTKFQLWFNGGLFAAAALMAVATKGFALITKEQAIGIGGLAGVFFLADLLVFLAYSGKESAFVVGSILAAMPIVVGITKMIIEKKPPTLYEFIGMALVVSGVLLFLRK